MLKTKDITLYGMLYAILAVLSFTPLGFITIFTFSITTIHIVVLIAAYTRGLKGGLIVGLGFGIMSLLRALIAPNTPFDTIFINPIISVLPRILFGALAGYIAEYLPKFNPKFNNPITIAIGSGFATVVHTALVLLAIIAMRPFIPLIGELLSDVTFFALFSAVFLSNAVYEVILAALVVPVVVIALIPKLKKVNSVKPIVINGIKSAKYYQEVLNIKDKMVASLQKLISFHSVNDPTSVTKNAPFGKAVKNALDFMNDLGKQDGFKVTNYDGYVVEIDYDQGQKETVMILGHVDIVPLGDGWKYPPLGGEIHDNVIYGRGAIDDKGPTIASYYAIKLIKDLKIPLKRKVRLVIGGNEESGFKCVDYYFNKLKRPHPEYGFAPDAEFPLIYGEKGIMNFSYSGIHKDSVIKSFKGGIAANSVIESSEFVLVPNLKLKPKFEEFLKARNLTGEYLETDSETRLKIIGKAAHGSKPNEGINAFTHPFEFLALNTKSELAAHFGRKLNNYEGVGLGINYKGTKMGDLTLNIGLASYQDNKYNMTLNIRYPIEVNPKILVENLQVSQLHNSQLLSDSKPLFFDLESPLVKTLLSTYQDLTGDTKNLPVTIGGGTYARATKNTVAFGMEFKPRKGNGTGNYHTLNEGLNLDDLVDGTLIYMHAIIRLANL
jgi:succinyl-diaminopimelate desuccinylase